MEFKTATIISSNNSRDIERQLDKILTKRNIIVIHTNPFDDLSGRTITDDELESIQEFNKAKIFKADAVIRVGEELPEHRFFVSWAKTMGVEIFDIEVADKNKMISIANDINELQ